MLLPLNIALKYMKSKKSSRFTSIISKSSIVGITIGIAVIITVLSIMNGFHSEMRNKILGMISHVIITGPDYELSNWQNIHSKIKNNNEVLSSAPYIEEKAMVIKGKNVHGIQIKGIIPELEKEVTNLEKNIVLGNLSHLNSKPYQISIGKDLALKLGVKLGDKITLVIPKTQTTVIGVIPKLKTFEVSSIFYFDMKQYDKNLAFINMGEAQKLFSLDNKITGLRLKLNDLFTAPSFRENIDLNTNEKIVIIDWTMMNKNFFEAIKMEKTMLLILMMLIVLVATFNILSSLFMVVSEKRSDIAILKTMGMDSRNIMNIFMIQGTILGVVGIILGIIFGLIICFNLESIISFIEYFLDRSLINSDVYFISKIPAKIMINDVVVVSLFSLFISFLATIYPSYKASKTEPAIILKGN
ncbi:MAG: lipoprotein-releasing ABC transporter permease subunit [Pseudomonadota bacterium]|nr:lipoprotein-releasing ABC transporter permease subunit [Pseudomonadota bacterium]|tara:strand:- start:37 stop:1278 length:1242 start_codon:yes stop_codon:yes gene_type:complete